MTAAMIAPTWITAVNPVTAGSSTLRSSSFSVIVRCPVEDTGRNSVRPSTTPSTAAFQTSTSLPYARALQRLRDLAQGLHAGLDVGHEERDRQCGDAGGSVFTHTGGDPVNRAEQAGAVDELQRYGGGRVPVPFGQVQLLYLVGGLGVPHPDGELVVEVLVPAAHPAHVQGGVPAHQLGAGGHVLAHHHRYGGHDVEAVERRGGPGPAGGDRGELLGGVLGGEEHRQPAVGQLPGQLQVPGADGGEVGRDPLARRGEAQLERLAPTGRQVEGVETAR